jgi:hypothetical protein
MVPGLKPQPLARLVLGTTVGGAGIFPLLVNYKKTPGRYVPWYSRSLLPHNTCPPCPQKFQDNAPSTSYSWAEAVGIPPSRRAVRALTRHSDRRHLRVSALLAQLQHHSSGAINLRRGVDVRVPNRV